MASTHKSLSSEPAAVWQEGAAVSAGGYPGAGPSFGQGGPNLAAHGKPGKGGLGSLMKGIKHLRPGKEEGRDRVAPGPAPGQDKGQATN
jgi:hypothetical protein